MYGLQPDALFVIVPALALPTKLAAAAYMCMFVAGTVAAMGSYTACIGKRMECVVVVLVVSSEGQQQMVWLVHNAIDYDGCLCVL